MEDQIFDVIIIGGGPAGLSAATYATRRSLKTLVLTSDIGGQISKSSHVENYPGYEGITGINLAMAFYNQAKKFGAAITFEEAKEIIKKDNLFEVKTHLKSYQCRALILAFGKKPRELGIPSEKEFRGKGVTYCATCDAPFFKDKTVIVVGGGNSALDAALLSATYSKKVYLIHRSQFRAEQILLDKVNQLKNITVMTETEIKEIIGHDKVESVMLSNGEKIETDGIIVEIGFVVDRSLITGFLETDEKGQVITNEMQETSVTGVFAAGDLTTTPYKQVVIAAGEGAKAALACFDFIQKHSGKKGILADWH